MLVVVSRPSAVTRWPMALIQCCSLDCRQSIYVRGAGRGVAIPVALRSNIRRLPPERVSTGWGETSCVRASTLTDARIV